MPDFVHSGSIVRKIWGASDTILFVFAGSSAEFALNKSVDWLYFTGRLPADPIGRLFSTVDYARRIVFASEENAYRAIDEINRIHQGVENGRGAVIPPEAYRDVLYMLIHYSIASYELLKGKLSGDDKEEIYDVFFRMGKRMHLEALPHGLKDWQRDRQLHLDQDLVRSTYTDDLFLQYRKHLGAYRYKILIEAQKLVVPDRVMHLMNFSPTRWLQPAVPIYRFCKKAGLDKPVRFLLLPGAYRARIDALDRPA